MLHPLSHMVLAPPARELWIDDLEQILGLHALVHEAHVATGAPPNHGMFALETREFFRDHLAERGRIYGLEDRQRNLTAYAVLGLPEDGAYNFGAWAGLPREMWQRVAHLDGVAVRPDNRGQKLQLLLIKQRLEMAMKFRRDLIYSTAAPGNLVSLTNLMTAGFVIVSRQQLFGGHDRFILAWADHRADEAVEKRFVAIDDGAGQERLIADNFVGAGGGQAPDGRVMLRFVPATAFKAPWSGLAPASKT